MFARYRTRTPHRTFLSIALAAAISALPGIGRSDVKADTVDTPVCRTHLENIDVILSRARADFESATATGLEAECASMHGQVRAMLAVRNVYRRCMTGDQRAGTVAMMDDSIEQTTGNLSARCARRSADARAD